MKTNGGREKKTRSDAAGKKWVLRRETDGGEETDAAELPMKERRMREQRGETGPGRSDGALQRSMKRASIIQQL